MCLLVAACEPVEWRAVPVEGTPEGLSGWQMLAVRDGVLRLRDDALPYDLNTPLFTDYAHKFRTVWMPAGRPAAFRQEGPFDFPVGTVFTKTFYYPREGKRLLRTADYRNDFSEGGLDLDTVHLVETRILVRRAEGWQALPYAWNEAQTEASLAITGAIEALTLAPDQSFHYVVPNKNECANCHVTDRTGNQLSPIGPKARHLDKPYDFYPGGGADQLSTWKAHGYLDEVPATIQATPRWQPGATDRLEARARGYLDINCGHCHSPTGSADTSGLFLHAGETDSRRLGVCKPPIAAGRGSGGRAVSIWPGRPDASMMVFRMETTDPGAMMPELGRSLVHEEGVDLIARWIESLPGECLSLSR